MNNKTSKKIKEPNAKEINNAGDERVAALDAYLERREKEKEQEKMMPTVTSSLLLSRIEDFKAEEESLLDDILGIMGLPNEHTYPINLEDDVEWYIVGDELIIHESDDDDEDYYELTYIVASLGDKGLIQYIGEDGHLTFVLAYPYEGSWEDSEIYVLDNNLNIKK
jgi:hypothetical protein